MICLGFSTALFLLLANNRNWYSGNQLEGIGCTTVCTILFFKKRVEIETECKNKCDFCWWLQKLNVSLWNIKSIPIYPFWYKTQQNNSFFSICSIFERLSVSFHVCYIVICYRPTPHIRIFSSSFFFFAFSPWTNVIPSTISFIQVYIEFFFRWN